MSEFSHLKNKLLAEQVEDEIYHYILETPLEPGAKLPNEFELGEKFGVGRSTVREAVKLLSSKGIVEVRRGSGTYVVTTAKGLSDPLNLRSVQDKNALALDLVNVRLLLEPGMAEMAALNASDEDIERIQRLCDRVESKIHSGDLYIAAGTLVQGGLVITGNLSMGEGAVVLGHIKVHGEAALARGACVKGALFALDGIRTAGNNYIEGPLSAGSNLRLGANSQIGNKQVPSSTSAWTIQLEASVRIYGSLSAVRLGEVLL